jgi:hypothetical protein
MVFGLVKLKKECRQNQLRTLSLKKELEEGIRVSFFIVVVYEKGKRILSVLTKIGFKF